MHALPVLPDTTENKQMLGKANKCCGQRRQMYATVSLCLCEPLPLSHESHQIPALFALSAFRNTTLLERILVFHPGRAALSLKRKGANRPLCRGREAKTCLITCR